MSDNLQFAVNAPVHALSFGQVTLGILREMYKRGLQPSYFPIAQPDVSVFNIQPDFGNWLQGCINRGPKSHKRSNPVFRLWHIQDSMMAYSEKQVLLSFFEPDGPGAEELNILRNQSKVLFTSKYTISTFEDYGLTNMVYCPLGFDTESFKNTDKEYFKDGRIVFGISQKFEARKSTAQMIKAWLSKYGNKREYFLCCAIYNPFLRRQNGNQVVDDNPEIWKQLLGGKEYFNIQFLPFLNSNADYNDYLNSLDCILACSAAESFDLPLFNSLCLGKHAVTMNSHVYKDYCNEENAVMIQPTGKRSLLDGVFFHQNNYSQGNGYTFDDADFLNACDLAIERVKKDKVNHAGKLLAEKFTYKNTVDIILAELQKL